MSAIHSTYDLPRRIRDQEDFEALRAALLALKEPEVDAVERWPSRPNTTIYVGRGPLRVTFPWSVDHISEVIDAWAKS